MRNPLANADPDASNRLARLDARYRAPLMSFFLRRVAERAEAEDLTQEVLVRMIARGGEIDLERADAFVFTIAANLIRDRARTAAARHRAAHAPIEDLYKNTAVDPDLVEDRSPEHVLLGRESLKAALSALNELGPRTRHIFVLYRLENMKRRDIAVLYGISVSAVEKHVAKALDHLMARLER